MASKGMKWSARVAHNIGNKSSQHRQQALMFFTERNP